MRVFVGRICTGMIDGLTNGDSIPLLQRMLQFAGQRQRILANNIANISTPGFRSTDVSIADFQKQLREAIESPLATTNGGHGALALRPTRQVQATPDGLVLHPEPVGDNILFHDGTDHNVERSMQDLVENFATYRAAVQLLRNRFELISAAIRERP
jgi:flagellar basal-body rod protein FlgB